MWSGFFFCGGIYFQLRMRVFLFVPCYIDQLFPSVAKSTLNVLENLGCDVVFPENQTCCGQPAYNSGYFDEARLMAMHEVNACLASASAERAFLSDQLSVIGDRYSAYNSRVSQFDIKKDYIVGPSASCVAMMRNFYPGLLGDDSRFAERINEFTSRVFEFTEFINKVIGVEKFRGKMNAVVSYHDSCHSLRELSINEDARDILERIDGLKLVELPYKETCCGFGGTFAVKFPEISCAMADEKLKNFETTHADVLVSGDVSCLMHLQGRARRIGIRNRFAHIAEIMEESISSF